MLRLPGFDSLYVFSVAARHLSFTAAAGELHRTQSAVSHRIKALERQIGVPLFERLAGRLELTEAGARLARCLEDSIADISRTLAGLSPPDDAGSVRVTMLPSVASRWLMPRLPRFLQQHPGIHVQIVADARVLDLRAERIDLAIRFGSGRYRGCDTAHLMSDRVLPVCSPNLPGSGAIRGIDELMQLPLLHDSGAEGDGSLSDWRSWLDRLGRHELSCAGGQRFSHAGLTIEAATLGLGVALARLSLVADHLRSGMLMCPLPLSTPTGFAYYLVTPLGAPAVAGLAELRDWLQAEARDVETVAESLREHEQPLRSRLAGVLPPEEESDADGGASGGSPAQ